VEASEGHFMTDAFAQFDAVTAAEWLSFYRPFLEIIGLVLVSAFIGYRCARLTYRSKVETRNDAVRVTQARSRRRLSHNAEAAGVLSRERDRLRRRVRGARKLEAAVKSSLPPLPKSGEFI
jgi:hypothetical protein